MGWLFTLIGMATLYLAARARNSEGSEDDAAWEITPGERYNVTLVAPGISDDVTAARVASGLGDYGHTNVTWLPRRAGGMWLNYDSTPFGSNAPAIIERGQETRAGDYAARVATVGPVGVRPSWYESEGPSV